MTTTEITPARRGYGALWATMPRELAYLLISFPITVVGFGLSVALFSAGVGTLATFFIGVLFLIAALYQARGFGTLDLAMLRFSGRPAIQKPDWQDDRARTGFFGWLRAVFGNGHYWLYLLHTGLIAFVVSTITFSIAVTWFAIALGGLTAWIWYGFIPNGDRDFFLSTWLADQWGWQLDFDGVAGDTVLQFILGVVFALTLPLVTRGLVWLHWAIARGLLGSFRSEALQREVVALGEQQGAAQSAEGHSLRRLERDIHDGPQQRLVRLQMDLAAAERQLDADPEKARSLLAEAMQQSKDALEELRALSRGFAPPILLDRGLIAALESAAVRNPVRTRVISDLPPGTEVPQEIERNAYFVVIEALTNATKHAGASDIEIRVAQRVDDRTWLDLTVTDDGAGGASLVEGHGIAGLHERLRGLGGTLEVLSPAGGPTILTAHLPLSTAVPASTS
jgi:signal transduction histidine kinase